jgi:hypothetical protein
MRSVSPRVFERSYIPAEFRARLKRPRTRSATVTGMRFLARSMALKMEDLASPDGTRWESRRKPDNRTKRRSRRTMDSRSWTRRSSFRTLARSCCSSSANRSVVTTGRDPRRIQLAAVERGMPSWANRAGSRSSQTRSRMRWSYARRKGWFGTGTGWTAGHAGASREGYDAGRGKVQGFRSRCVCDGMSAECLEMQLGERPARCKDGAEEPDQ